MVIHKKVSTKAAVKASNRKVARRTLRANDEIAEEEIIDDVVEAPEVEVAPEAADLLFEAEDVAELVAEVTGEEVAVTIEDDAVTFEVGEDEYVVEADGDEELVESSTKVAKKAPVKASRKVTRKVARRR